MRKPKPLESKGMYANVYNDEWGAAGFIELDSLPIKDLKRLRKWLDKAIAWLEVGRRERSKQ